MPLSNLPGPWRWEVRNGWWWRIHDQLRIEDGPHSWDELNIGMGGFGNASDWYDRQGEPIPMLVASEYLNDYDYKVVAKDAFVFDGEPVEVSTVWLGLNHNWWPGKPPLIFETMIFGGKYDLESWRYATEEQALAGHAEAMALLQLEEQIRREQP